MHVGYVLKKYPRLSETFILNEILGLEETGVRVSIMSLRLPDDGRFHGALSQVAADVRYLPHQGAAPLLEAMEAVTSSGPGAELRLERALAFVSRLPFARRASVLLQGLCLADLARRDGINHLHAHFMTVAAHTCYVAHLISDVSFSITAHAKDIYRESVDRAVFSQIAAAGRVVTVCEANRAFIESQLLTVSGASVEVVYNGLPDMPTEPGAGPATREPGLILAVGRLVEKKGFDVLIDACSRLRTAGKRFRCRIIGEGDAGDALRQQVVERGLVSHVSIEGARSREDVLDAMRRARVLAAPCVVGADGNQDALPTVILEAQAMGLPVVATPVGGIPEMLADGEQGLLVSQRDPDALAEGLTRMLEFAPGEWTRMSESGRRNVQLRFSREQTLPRLLALFRDCAGTPEARGDEVRCTQ